VDENTNSEQLSKLGKSKNANEVKNPSNNLIGNVCFLIILMHIFSAQN
jgi:hypothetical protein